MENDDLSRQLEELDVELAEGDITQKGYQKRRTLILSQYGLVSPSQASSSSMSGPSHPATASLRTSTLISEMSDSPTSATFTTATMGYGSGGTMGRSSVDGNGWNGNQRRDSYAQSFDPNSQISPTSREPGLNLIPPQGLHVRNISNTSDANSQYSAAPQPVDNNAYDGNSYVYPQQTPPPPSRSNTLDAGNYFSDFRSEAYDHRDSIVHRDSMQRPESNYSTNMMNRYSTGEQAGFSPTAATAPPMLTTSDLPPPEAVNHLLPLEPRDVPFAVYDPHNSNIPMSKFDNIASILRHRGRMNGKQLAYVVLDSKGKEMAACSWEKLAARAEKVAQVIREKSNLYRGDRVALVYRDVELVEFAVALLGCFIAGVVAVPVNQPEDYQKLNFILTSTQAHLALTTDSNLKAFQRDLTTQKLSWPRGVEWWKTNEFGSYHPKKKDDVPPLQVPELAYIEFSRAPTGDLRGVVLSHRTLLHQMGTLNAMLATVPEANEDTFSPGLRGDDGSPLVKQKGDTLVSYLDPRQGIGMIMSILLNVYNGQTTIWCSQNTATSPGLYANIITRYKATLCLADYPALKLIAYNYQSSPMTTRNYAKKVPVNFKYIRWMLIDALTVDADFHEILADRWLKPLGNTKAREIVAPMLCLPEHGGMVIAMRDWLGGEERLGCPLDTLKNDDDEEEPPPEKKDEGYSSLLPGLDSPVTATKRKVTELSEVLLDKEALKTNDVVIQAWGDEAQKRGGEHGVLRVGAFGYPIPDATLSVVDPETSLLCSANVIGEIWVDSPSLSGGFWAMPKQTETIFHARPYQFLEGNPTPVAIEPEFLRTGLLGCVIDGKVFIMGLYEDRLRQRVEWVDEENEREEYRYFFVQHLVITMMKKMSKIYDCSAFDVFTNGEHLPIILLESQAASTAPQTTGGAARQLDIALLDSLSEKCMDVLLTEHQLRVYCVMITAPNTLPRVLKNGRREIGNMLCRKEFDAGALPCVHVKFGVERAVRNLPIGVDPVGGIWSPQASMWRENQLVGSEKQYSGIDYREVVIDDRTSTPLNNFSSIVDLLQWRVARQSDELSYCSIDSRGREGKGVTWKKLDLKIAAIAQQMRNKWKLKAGDHVILIYTHSEDFVYAVHACFSLGLVAMPLAPLDQNRLSEDIPALLHMVTDFNVRAILVNHEVDHLLKNKPLSSHIKQSASVLDIKMPPTHNTAKPPKVNSGCRDLGFTVNPQWVQPDYVSLVWTYWTPDQRRVSVGLAHQNIMGICKVMKETCQMTSSRPVVGCVRSTSGVGFVISWLMGIFVGSPTYLVSPVDFAQNPMSLFLALSRYKIKDTYATPQMLDHATSLMPAKGFTLHELKNMMITSEGRPRADIFQRVRLHFAGSGLDRTAINTIYTHVLHPMVATRSYMCIEPIELWLDPKFLRQGLIYPVDPDTHPNALLLQDSGMVPVSTQVAIVNPETCRLCQSGEYGEIWVESEACVQSFYGSKDAFDAERFNGRTADGDPRIRYVRTGDLGFLHPVSRPIGPNGAQVEMEILFVLGGIGETFEVTGLSHFPMDIEASVEQCHRNIVPGGCAVFQAGGLVVVLVEVRIKSYLASMVPVIVNSILDEHQIVVDIVAFVGKGDFPRSRLGEKQRGKILASWVTRKMRTIAQFGIRDTHAEYLQNQAPSTHAPGSRPTSITDSARLSTVLQPTTIMEGVSTHLNYSAPLEQDVSELSAAISPVELSAGGDDGDTPTAERDEMGMAPPVPEKSERRSSMARLDGVEVRGSWEFPEEAIQQMRLHDGDIPKDKKPGFGMAM